MATATAMDTAMDTNTDMITRITMTMTDAAGMNTATVTAMITGMATDLHTLLGLIWLASPALPVGGFSYSEGLEAAIDRGLVHDEASCATWLTDQLWVTQARGDLAVVAQATEAWMRHDVARLTDLADWVLVTRESAEMRLQTMQMGKSMLEWLRNLQQADAMDLDQIGRAHV